MVLVLWKGEPKQNSDITSVLSSWALSSIVCLESIVPITDKRKSEPSEFRRVNIGDLHLQGPQFWKFTGKIDVVIKKCIPDEKQHQKIYAVKLYLKAEEIPSQHPNYSMANTVMFQAEADQFMREWVALYGLSVHYTVYLIRI
jgi:hypothetical protein